METETRRLVIKFHDNIQPYVDGFKDKPGVEVWQKLKDQFGGIALRRMFRVRPRRIQEISDRLYKEKATKFLAYFVLELKPDVPIEKLLDKLQSSPWKRYVELAYIDVNTIEAGANYRVNQPHGFGFDAAALRVPGGDGQGQHLVDVERGWTVDHVSLLGHGLIAPQWMVDSKRAHGTAALGIACGKPNGFGPTGIAPEAAVQLVSCVNISRAAAITEAMLKLEDAAPQAANDARAAVLLIEQQSPMNVIGRGSAWSLPVEVMRETYNAIKLAVDHGITVVECAGNGGDDLATYRHTGNDEDHGKYVFDPRIRQNSGAIVVGSVYPAINSGGHVIHPQSNFGSRVDCYAWGDNIDAPTSGPLAATPNNFSVDTFAAFAGTSGAGAIIAGMALVIQSAVTIRDGQPLTPAELRNYLSDWDNGTPVFKGGAQIGVMPDLVKIFGKLGF
jgi:serine protease